MKGVTHRGVDLHEDFVGGDSAAAAGTARRRRTDRRQRRSPSRQLVVAEEPVAGQHGQPTAATVTDPSQRLERLAAVQRVQIAQEVQVDVIAVGTARTAFSIACSVPLTIAFTGSSTSCAYSKQLRVE